MIEPDSTSLAPHHKISTTEEKIIKMTDADNIARARMRFRAASNEVSIEVENLVPAIISWVNDWTARMAPRYSAAKALESANVSCAKRDNLRTRRPMNTSGNTINGKVSNTRPDSDGLVTIIMMIEPTISTKLRNARETLAPTAVLIWVVSAVRRESTSPTRDLS